MKNISKVRIYSKLRKTIYYHDDGTKYVRYWESVDSFCNNLGIE